MCTTYTNSQSAHMNYVPISPLTKFLWNSEELLSSSLWTWEWEEEDSDWTNLAAFASWTFTKRSAFIFFISHSYSQTLKYTHADYRSPHKPTKLSLCFHKSSVTDEQQTLLLYTVLTASTAFFLHHTMFARSIYHSHVAPGQVSLVNGGC